MTTTQTPPPPETTPDETTPGEPVEQAAEPAGGPIAAPASKSFALRWILIAGLLPIGLGAYFMYDGFVGYPGHNAEIERLEQQEQALRAEGKVAEADAVSTERLELGTKHNSKSILVQKLLGFTLIPLGIGMIVWTLRDARGEIRLDADDTLHAPGHPPVRPGDITAIDDARWDRKGKCFIAYKNDAGQGTIKLDDFVRERPPTDAIHDRIVHVHKQLNP